jgi:hypothetical protein
MKTKAIALVVVLLFSSAASSQVLMRVFHTYSGWERLSRSDRMAYLQGMMDTLTTVGSDQNAQYYSDCARNNVASIAQLTDNLQGYVRTRLEVQGFNPVTRALLDYLRELCG